MALRYVTAHADADECAAPDIDEEAHPQVIGRAAQDDVALPGEVPAEDDIQQPQLPHLPQLGGAPAPTAAAPPDTRFQMDWKFWFLDNLSLPPFIILLLVSFILAIVIFSEDKPGGSVISCDDSNTGACDEGSDPPSVGEAVLVIVVMLPWAFLSLAFLHLAARGHTTKATQLVLQVGWLVCSAFGFLLMVVAVNGKITSSLGFLALFAIGFFVFFGSLYTWFAVNATLACLAITRCIQGNNPVNDYSLFKVLLREAARLALEFKGMMVNSLVCCSACLLLALYVLPAAQKSSGPAAVLLLFVASWACTAFYYFQQIVNDGVVSRCLYQAADPSKYTIDSVIVGFKKIGSVCLGALIAPLLETIGSILSEIRYCGVHPFEGCVQRAFAAAGLALEYFGAWCMVPISQHDTTFFTAARRIAQQATNGGEAYRNLVQYATTGLVTESCAHQAALIGLQIGALVGHAGGDGGWMDVGVLALCGCIAGLVPALAMLSPLQSFTTTMLVTWAEDRSIVARFSQDLHNNLAGAQGVVAP